MGNIFLLQVKTKSKIYKFTLQCVWRKGGGVYFACHSTMHNYNVYFLMQLYSFSSITFALIFKMNINIYFTFKNDKKHHKFAMIILLLLDLLNSSLSLLSIYKEIMKNKWKCYCSEFDTFCSLFQSKPLLYIYIYL